MGYREHDVQTYTLVEAERLKNQTENRQCAARWTQAFKKPWINLTKSAGTDRRIRFVSQKQDEQVRKQKRQLFCNYDETLICGDSEKV